MTVLRTGSELITAERERQQTLLGYDLARDQELNDEEQLARVAAVYAAPCWQRPDGLWPWSAEDAHFTKRDDPSKSWKRDEVRERIQELVRAGALLAAEIDRLQAL